VTAFGLLAEVDSGYPVLLSEMTILTALRTAATSAMAARRWRQRARGPWR
jgi:ornithine cyclodeaminase